MLESFSPVGPEAVAAPPMALVVAQYRRPRSARGAIPRRLFFRFPAFRIVAQIGHLVAGGVVGSLLPSGWGWVGYGIDNPVDCEGGEATEGLFDPLPADVRHVEEPEMFRSEEDESGGRRAGEQGSKMVVGGGGADAEALHDGGWGSVLVENRVPLMQCGDLDGHYWDLVAAEEGPINCVTAKTR